MWLLLKEDISKVFKSEYTYLFPINKNNFFIGKIIVVRVILVDF